ncbi:MAG: hypothetical protein MJ066_03390 [Clostridia bacterium]|nr:hypothetical protein [Clostridia bacterium]
MEEKFICGILLGMLGGALVATNSVKARQVIKDTEQQVKKKVGNLTQSKKSSKN